MDLEFGVLLLGPEATLTSLDSPFLHVTIYNTHFKNTGWLSIALLLSQGSQRGNLGSFWFVMGFLIGVKSCYATQTNGPCSTFYTSVGAALGTSATMRTTNGITAGRAWFLH